MAVATAIIEFLKKRFISKTLDSCPAHGGHPLNNFGLIRSAFYIQPCPESTNRQSVLRFSSWNAGKTAQFLLTVNGASYTIPSMLISRFASLTLALTTVALSQELPTQKVLTMDLAQTIAQEAIAKCRADGYKVTVTVVDSANMLKAFLRDDGSNNVTIEVGRMKTNFVMYYGRASGPPANLAAGAPLPYPSVPGIIYALGGVPIKVGNQLIGAVSVSGAPGGERDAACANAALAKVADRLK